MTTGPLEGNSSSVELDLSQAVVVAPPGLSGPEAISYRNQAMRLFKAAGRDVQIQEVPVEAVKRELVRAGVPPWNAEGLTELFELYAGGGAQMVTSGVKDTLERDPRSIEDFAKDHVEAFKA